MSETLDDINKQITELRRQQRKMEASNFHDTIIPKINSAIGTTYVFRNNSHGDVFRKLLDVAFSKYHAWIIHEKCQIDCGKAKLELEYDLIVHNSKDFPPVTGWQLCDQDEYNTIRLAVLDQINNPTLLKQY